MDNLKGKEKTLCILLVISCTLIFSISFIRTFSFEKSNAKEPTINSYYPKVNSEYVAKLYSYIPEYDSYGRMTMYGYLYTKYQNLSYDVVLGIIYNYIIKYDSLSLLGLSMQDLRNQGIVKEGNDSEITPLYMIPLDKFIEVGHMMFGSGQSIPETDFLIDYETRGHYMPGKGYQIYKIKSERSPDFIVERVFHKYEITNNNNTIIIYDYYVKCDKESGTCYDDEKKTKVNSVLRNRNGAIYLKNKLVDAQGYMHTFKYENGSYYWYSSELAN